MRRLRTASICGARGGPGCSPHPDACRRRSFPRARRAGPSIGGAGAAEPTESTAAEELLAHIARRPPRARRSAVLARIARPALAPTPRTPCPARRASRALPLDGLTPVRPVMWSPRPLLRRAGGRMGMLALDGARHGRRYRPGRHSHRPPAVVKNAPYDQAGKRPVDLATSRVGVALVRAAWGCRARRGPRLSLSMRRTAAFRPLQEPQGVRCGRLLPCRGESQSDLLYVP